MQHPRRRRDRRSVTAVSETAVSERQERPPARDRRYRAKDQSIHVFRIPAASDTSIAFSSSTESR